VDTILAVLILMNSLFHVLELELEGQQITFLTSRPIHAEAIAILAMVNFLFDLWWIIEWCLTLWFQRRMFFRQIANIMNTLLMAIAAADIISYLAAGGKQSNQMKHLFRALSSLRLLRFFHSLRSLKGTPKLLVKSWNSFLYSLFWAMVFLGIFMCSAALVVGNLLQDFILSDEDEEHRLWVWKHYGTALRAIYTLYEITFAGSWPSLTRPVVETVDAGYAGFFLLYITVIAFGLIRVITAVFLKDTLDAANNDAELQLSEKMQKKAEYAAKLEGIFSAIDSSGDGIITEARLQQSLQNPRVEAYFQTLDLDVHESTALFHILDDGDGGVTLDEFIDGMVRCKGPARAIDQVAMHSELKQLDKKLLRLTENMDQVLGVPIKRSKKRLSTASHLKAFRQYLPECEFKRGVS